MGWSNPGMDELAIGQSPTQIVLSTQLPQELIDYYGSDLKSGILFYWSATEYFYIINLANDITPLPLQEIIFGFFSDLFGPSFNEMMIFDGFFDQGIRIPATAPYFYMPGAFSAEDRLEISDGAELIFTPWNNTVPSSNALYVDSAGRLRYKGGVTNTIVAPN